MKARVKATGEIGIVSQIDVLRKDDFASFSSNKVEILQNYADATIEPDYWTRLEHQYAGMAMQGLLTNTAMAKLIHDDKTSVKGKTGIFSEWAQMYAHALVDKYKKEERK